MASRVCSIDGCGRPHKSLGWCDYHYLRLRGAERPCSIEGCEGVAGRPGTARGLCSSHYKRWKRYGDPLGQREFVNKGQPCAAEDCDKPAEARGLCSMHRTRLDRHGTLDHPQPWARAPEEHQWCPRCQTYKPLDDFHHDRSTRRGLSSYCKVCGRELVAQWRHRNPDKVSAQYAYVAGPGRERHNELARKSAAKARAEGRGRPSPRRARLKGRQRESFTRLEIAERDGWRCQICKERIGKRYSWPHPRSLSIDHIVPIEAGGDHVRSNVQATHLRCNLSKQAKGTDQLRLIG